MSLTGFSPLEFPLLLVQNSTSYEAPSYYVTIVLRAIVFHLLTSASQSWTQASIPTLCLRSNGAGALTLFG